MISIATLNELQDAELRTAQNLITDILRKRDDDRKEKALEEARAIDARALNEKRAVLAAAGLTLKTVNGNGKKKAARGPVYHSGHTYQHPANKMLLWSGKGKKPGWLLEIEAEGKKPLEIT